jgi:hypothetical protein
MVLSPLLYLAILDSVSSRGSGSGYIHAAVRLREYVLSYDGVL